MNAPKTYHHGDLRTALLNAARAKLATDGHEALSLRALARDVGVASSAPYAHFVRREALLWALIDESTRELCDRFKVIADSHATAEDKLAMAGRAYLDFARAEPERMRLIYASPLTDERIVPGEAAQLLEIFDGLVADVMSGGDKGQVRDVAIGCWSALHGFAMLRLHNRLAPEIDAEHASETVVAAAVRLARTAGDDLRARPPSPGSDNPA